MKLAPDRSPQEAFGDLLRQVRGHKNFSVEDLASRSGIPLSRLMRFESGMLEPTLSELFRLGHALKARPASIIEGVEFLMGGSVRRPPLRSHDEPQISPPL